MFYDTYNTLDEITEDRNTKYTISGSNYSIYHILKQLILSILHELLPKVDNVCLPTMQFATIIEDFF